MRRDKKIAIVGAGNAACISALYFYIGSRLSGGIEDITIYYDPNVPIERVGQGHTLDVIRLIFDALEVNWLHNPIGATPKTGINYENWGKKNHNFFHDFPLGGISFHYSPHLLSKTILECGYFKVVEKNIQNPEEEIDADYIIDCRGKGPNDFQKYDKLINPLNSVVLSRMPGKDSELHYTRCVATPDGWTFVIPNHDSVSYGYLYNDQITTKENATKTFVEMFDVIPDGHLRFNNYIGRSMWHGKRTILNGNRFAFLEPMEATSTCFHRTVARRAYDHIFNGMPRIDANNAVRTNMKQIETFILWHYQFGSKFDTPFWEYAKSLPFHPDESFKAYLSASRRSHLELVHKDYMKNTEYGTWPTMSFRLWEQYMEFGELK